MLTPLFITRNQHDRIIKTYDDELTATIEQRDNAYEAHDEAQAKIDATFALVAQAQRERDEARREYTNAVNRERKVTELLQRALTQLQQVVNAPRSGGKQWREDRERLFADAMLAGLWEEVK